MEAEVGVRGLEVGVGGLDIGVGGLGVGVGGLGVGVGEEREGEGEGEGEGEEEGDGEGGAITTTLRFSFVLIDPLLASFSSFIITSSKLVITSLLFYLLSVMLFS